VRSYLKLNFVADTISKGKDLQEIISSMSRIRNQAIGDKYALSSGKCPSLVFFYTDKKKDVKPKKDDKGPIPLTKEAEISRKTAEFVFNNEDSYKIYILGKFFSCIEVNTNNIPVSDNPIISFDNSPMLVLTDIDGKVKLSNSGNAIGFTSTATGMMEIIKEFYPKIEQLVDQINPLMNDLEKAEYQIIETNIKIADLVKDNRDNKKDKKDKDNKESSSYKTRKAKFDEELKETQDKKSELIRKMDEIIKDFLSNNKKEEKKS